MIADRASSANLRAFWASARPDLDISPMEVIAPLKQIQYMIEAALEPLYHGADVTAPELDLLIALRYTENPVIARSLAAALNCSPAAISKTLAKLEKRGYIERRPSPSDKRAALVTATEAGRAAVDAMFPRQLAAEGRLLEPLGADRAKVVEALGLLEKALTRAIER